MNRILDRNTLQEVRHTIGRNKRRSIVTSFGVFWGIFMLVILLSMSTGLQNGIERMTSSIAANMIAIMPSRTTKPYKGFKQGRLWNMTMQDVAEIRARVPEISAISGIMYTYRAIEYAGKKDDYTITGIKPEHFRITLVDLVAGRMLNEHDGTQQRKVCLLGKKILEETLGVQPQDILGKAVRIDGHSFTVVGVVASKADSFTIGNSPSWSAYVPIQTLSTITGGGMKLHQLLFTTYDVQHNAKAISQVEEILRENNFISPEDTGTPDTFDTQEIIGTFQSINFALQILVWIVGIGTLLTGVVGVSNILLVTVRERTQEIGVRRALGAKPADIIRQLLLESTILTSLAGLTGLVLGVGIMALVASALGSSQGLSDSGALPIVAPIIKLSTAISATLIIIVSGLVAGFIPATKAVEIRAIEAIREE